jgi:hypothetical protein
MCARFPVSLNASFMAAKTGLVLYFGGFTRIFAECDQPADTFTAAGGDMIATRAVTIFASSFLRLVARIEQKNSSHHGRREFLKGGSVTGLTNFIADVSRRA